MQARGDLPPDRRLPADARLSPDHPRRTEILARHETALADGVATYVDPGSGLRVFTARYLWDRGFCCETGCRHCPYVER